MKYKNYKLKDIFNVTNSKGINANQISFGGEHPYVTRTEKNNGIIGYINEDITKLNPANTISFGQDTWKFFYQEKPYFTGNRIKVLNLKSHALTKNIAMFLIPYLNKMFSNLSWGTNANEVNFSDRIISLPVTEKEEIDWDYMQERIEELEQERIEELEQERIEELEQYLIATGLNDYELTEEDKEILATKLTDGGVSRSTTSGSGYWKEARMFRVGDLFTVKGTKSLDAGALEFRDTGVNFVGRTDENNGVQGKIDRQVFEPNDAKTMTATVIGNYKYVKYQEEPYYCSQNVNKLTPVFLTNKLLGLYFRNIIQKFVSLYDGQQSGYKLDELRDYTFILPIRIDSNNTPVVGQKHTYHPDGYIPDWDFMEKYIRAIEKVVIADVAKYKDSVIENTKKVAKSA